MLLRKPACQADSRQARVYWQISWPADAWEDKRGYRLEAQGTGLNVLLVLEKGTEKLPDRVQISNVCQPSSLLA